MNFGWKTVGYTLGGVVTGVGAVACLPVFGAVGVVTATGFCVGGLVGASSGLATSIFSESKDSQDKTAEERLNKEKAERAADAARFNEDNKRYAAQEGERKQYFDYVIALHAVGLAYVAIAGHVSDNDFQELSLIIAGIAADELPDWAQQRIQELRLRPPTIAKAYALARYVENESMGKFDLVIELLMARNGTPSREEKEFVSAWTQLKAA